jgi:hypothetical protein
MPYNPRQEQNYVSNVEVTTNEAAAQTIAAFIRREAAKSNGVKIRENGGLARGAVHAIQDQLDVMRAYTGLGQRGEVILGTRSRRENQGLLAAGSLRIAELLANPNGLNQADLVAQVRLLLQDENFNGKTIISGMRQRNDEITNASERIGADLFRLFENKSNPDNASGEMQESIENLRRAMEANLEEARVTTGETFKFRQARAKGAIGVLKGAAAFAGGFAGGIGAIIGVSAVGGLNGIAYANNKNNYHRENYENNANSMDQYVNNLKTNYDNLNAILNPVGLPPLTDPAQIANAMLNNQFDFFNFAGTYKNIEQAAATGLTLSPVQTTLLNKYTNFYNLINTPDVINLVDTQPCTIVDNQGRSVVYSELINTDINIDENFILNNRVESLNNRANMTQVSAGQHFVTHGLQAGAIAGLGAIVKSTGMLDGIKHSAGNTIRSVGDGFNSVLRPGLKSDNMTVPGLFGMRKGVSMDQWSVLSKKPAIIEFAKANNLDVIKNPVQVSRLMREAGLSSNSTDEQIASANLDAFTKNINSDAFKGGLIDKSGSLNYDNEAIVALAKKAKIDPSDHAAVDKMLEDKKIIINSDTSTDDINKLKKNAIDLEAAAKTAKTATPTTPAAEAPKVPTIPKPELTDETPAVKAGIMGKDGVYKVDNEDLKKTIELKGLAGKTPEEITKSLNESGITSTTTPEELKKLNVDLEAAAKTAKTATPTTPAAEAPKVPTIPKPELTDETPAVKAGIMGKDGVYKVDNEDLKKTIELKGLAGKTPEEITKSLNESGITSTTTPEELKKLNVDLEAAAKTAKTATPTTPATEAPKVPTITKEMSGITGISDEDQAKLAQKFGNPKFDDVTAKKEYFDNLVKQGLVDNTGKITPKGEGFIQALPPVEKAGTVIDVPAPKSPKIPATNLEDLKVKPSQSIITKFGINTSSQQEAYNKLGDANRLFLNSLENKNFKISGAKFIDALPTLQKLGLSQEEILQAGKMFETDHEAAGKFYSTFMDAKIGALAKPDVIPAEFKTMALNFGKLDTFHADHAQRFIIESKKYMVNGKIPADRLPALTTELQAYMLKHIKNPVLVK